MPVEITDEETKHHEQVCLVAAPFRVHAAGASKLERFFNLAVAEWPRYIAALQAARAERLSLLGTITGQDQDLFVLAKENAALGEWKEQAAPTLAAALATIERVREALKKIQAFGDPHVYILEEALGDGTSHD